MDGHPAGGQTNGNGAAGPPAARAGDGPGEAWAYRLRYQELFDFAPDGLLVTDRHGVVREANHAAAALLGCRKDFLLDKPLGLFVLPGERPLFYRLLAGNGPADGTRRWEGRVGGPGDPGREVTAFVEPSPADGGALRWLLRDVDGVRGTERALRVHKRFVDSVVESAEAYILIVDAAGRIARSNPYLHAACGRGPHDLYGLDWREALLPPEDRPAAAEMTAQAARGGAGRTGVLGLVCRHGGRRAATWSARALGDDGGELLLLLGHDVTEIQEAQRQALRAERLAAIGQTVTALAHESRSALQILQACASLLAARLHDRPAELELVGQLQQAQDDLHRLYEDVRAYAGGLALAPAACDLATVWRKSWADVAAARPEPGARLHEDVDGLALRVVADPFRLAQIFRNLFDNALAAAGPGAEVWVSCRPAVLGGAEAVALAVRDNGPGLSPGQRSRLFEPFFTTKSRGTGLGLALCRRLAEAHGGRLEASGSGPGAEFVLTLPRRMR